MEIDCHPAVVLLRGLLPEAVVVGGSFVKALPSPRDLTPSDRRATFLRVSDDAVEDCLAHLVQSAGLPAGTQIPRGTDGTRRWPTGFLGSITDKGTVVAAAVAPITVLTAIGIDIERDGGSGKALDDGIIGNDRRPIGFSAQVATLIAFAAKEAVFKAQFAMTGTPLSYSDIVIDWPPTAVASLYATARCTTLPESFSVRCSVTGRWIVAAALLSARPA